MVHDKEQEATESYGELSGGHLLDFLDLLLEVGRSEDGEALEHLVLHASDLRLDQIHAGPGERGEG